MCPQSKPDTCDGVCVALASDPEHCHACDVACPAGAVCKDTGCGPAPSTMVSSPGCGSMRLGLSGSDLYWVERASGKVFTVALSPGVEPLELATGQLNPTGIAVDDSGVYWVNEGDGSEGSSQVLRRALPLTDAAPVVLVTGAGPSVDDNVIRSFALHEGTLLYTLGHDVHAVSVDTEIAADMIVGTATNYDLDPPQAQGYPSALAVSGDYVVWSTASRLGIERDDLLEGASGYDELAESQGALLLTDLGASGASAYWANAEAVVSSSVETAAGASPGYLSKSPDFSPLTALTIATDGAYFASSSGLVLAHPLAGVEPAELRQLARDQPLVSSIVKSADRLIWATSECAIVSLPTVSAP